MTIFDWRQNHGNERISYIERAWECLLMSNLRVAGENEAAGAAVAAVLADE
jgi:hypothetical protein